MGEQEEHGQMKWKVQGESEWCHFGWQNRHLFSTEEAVFAVVTVCLIGFLDVTGSTSTNSGI